MTINRHRGVAGYFDNTNKVLEDNALSPVLFFKRLMIRDLCCEVNGATHS